MTDVDIDIAVNKFAVFLGCLWLMHEEPTQAFSAGADSLPICISALLLLE